MHHLVPVGDFEVGVRKANVRNVFKVSRGIRIRTYMHAYIHTYIHRYIHNNIGIRIYIEIHMIVSLNKGAQYVPPKRVPEFWKLAYIHVQVWDYCSELFQSLLRLRNSEPSRRL